MRQISCLDCIYAIPIGHKTVCNNKCKVIEAYSQVVNDEICEDYESRTEDRNY
jgi:hypothetical protein